MAFPSNAVDALIAKVEVNFGRDNVDRTIYAGGGGTVTADEQILCWINDTIRMICQRQNFWFQHTSYDFSVIAASTSETLPADFKDEDSFWILDATTNEYTELNPISWEDYYRDYDDVTQGTPESWLLEASTVRFRPVPNGAYTIRMFYWEYPDALTTTGTSNDLVDRFPKLIEYGATSMAFASIEQLETSQFWESKFDKEMIELIQYSAQRELPDEMVVKPRPDVLGTSTRRIKNRRYG